MSISHDDITEYQQDLLYDAFGQFINDTIDRARFNDLRGMMGAHGFRRFIQVTLQESNELHDSIFLHLRDKDFEKLREAAHALKSASAQMGAVHLAVCCYEMEKYATDDDYSGLSKQYLKMERLYSASHELIRALLRQEKEKEKEKERSEEQAEIISTAKNANKQ